MRTGIQAGELAQALGLAACQVRGLARAGIGASFAPPALKQQLLSGQNAPTLGRD